MAGLWRNGAGELLRLPGTSSLMHGEDCCCDFQCDCTTLAGIALIGKEIEITLSGFASGVVCTSGCESMNGTYLLAFDPSSVIALMPVACTPPPFDPFVGPNCIIGTNVIPISHDCLVTPVVEYLSASLACFSDHWAFLVTIGPDATRSSANGCFISTDTHDINSMLNGGSINLTQLTSTFYLCEGSVSASG